MLWDITPDGAVTDAPVSAGTDVDLGGNVHVSERRRRVWRESYGSNIRSCSTSGSDATCGVVASRSASGSTRRMEPLADSAELSYILMFRIIYDNIPDGCS